MELKLIACLFTEVFRVSVLRLSILLPLNLTRVQGTLYIRNALYDVKTGQNFIIIPKDGSYPLTEDVHVSGLHEFLSQLPSKLQFYS